jgi:subtilisin family serine protease
MKKTIFVIFSTVFLCFRLSAQSGEDFYYYFGEKIFLQQRTDKIYLKLAPKVSKKSLLSLVDKDESLQLTSYVALEDSIFNFAILEVKNKKEGARTTIESYKAMTEVISATYLFQHNSVIYGFADEFVIKLKQTTSFAQLYELAEKNDCKIGKENSFVKNQFMICVSANSKLNALQMSNLFYETGLFEFSSPNFLILNPLNSNDTYFEHQWGLKNTGQYGGSNGVDIKVEQAWAITEGNPNIRVAVIDDGVDLIHPDLAPNILQPGYDATGVHNSGAPHYTDEAHGTACAGIIAAVKDNEMGISGVAPNCKIIPIHMDFTLYYLATYSEWLANAIELAWQNGADIISNSWSGVPFYCPLTNAIDKATTQGRDGKGCVVVFSSGNEDASAVNYPADLPNVIAVGATSQCGERVSPSSCNGEDWGSNYGAMLDVVAPGVSISTTDRHDDSGYNHYLALGVTNDYDDLAYTRYFSGTSAACPHVSGVAALVLSVNSNFTSQQVRDIIESTAQKVGGYNYQNTSGRPNGTWHEEMGYGLVNAYAAVQAACEASNNNLVDETITTNTTITGCNINVQNVTVNSGAKLTIDGVGATTIEVPFETQPDAELDIIAH